jgi:2-iminobutanoate/2-iminopropanoate deaminase
MGTAAIQYILDVKGAPKAIGPYAIATIDERTGTVYLSGQVPLDPESGAIVTGGIDAQAQRVMDNLKAVLISVGSDFTKVLSSTIYLTNLGDFAVVNKVYESALGDGVRPARATIQVAALPKGANVEISMIALR